MALTLPYVTAPGNIEKALKAIKIAATPSAVSQDFVKTILKIPGGSGDQITAFLKKIGFAAADGTPTSRYRAFRNPSTAGKAAADALREAYAPLYLRNEYMHSLSDEQLKGLLIEETGVGEESAVPGLALAAINALKAHADFSESEQVEPDEQISQARPLPPIPFPQANSLPDKSVGLNLSYTINLNLPATSDIAVFNAIFKSLKENLLKDVQ